MIVLVRPVGNVATDAISCRHGKEPSDAHQAGVTTPQRPTNDIKAEFYPARLCSPERPDGGKRASPNDATNLAPDDVINLAPTTGTPTSPASADSHADSSASVNPTQREVVCTTHPATKVHYIYLVHKASRSAKRLSRVHPSSQSGPRGQSGRKSSRAGSGRARIGFGWQFVPPYYENTVNTQ